MKQKYLINTGLILFVIIIYGYLSIQLFGDDPTIDEIATPITLEQAMNKQHSNELPAHSIDPFRSKAIPKRVVKPKPKPAPIIEKPIITLPQFLVSGKVFVNNGWQLTINFQNQYYYIRKNQMLQGMRFTDITNDSIKISYQNEKFTLRNEVQ